MTAISNRSGLWATLAALLLCGLAAAPALAAEPDREQWVGRWEALQAKQAELSTELETARIDYRRGRRGNRGRGEERVELLERIGALEKELASVEEEIAAFPEEARRAGALPGWFREG